MHDLAQGRKNNSLRSAPKDVKVKILVVDDSASMRNAITSLISSDPGLQVVGTARNGVEAIDKVFNLNPDIVTMGVEMPKMDGIEALRVIMDKSPLPVIMVSSMTTEGAKVTLDALEIGAVDFIPNNLSDMSVNSTKIKEVLNSKLKQIGERGLRPLRKSSRKPIVVENYSTERKISIIAIGSSTGGPRVLQEILSTIPESFPMPIVIAQHMPPAFTGPFANRLDSLSSITVKEAQQGESLKKGLAYVSPGHGHMRIVRKNSIEVVIRIDDDHADAIYKPSVNILFRSVQEAYPSRCLGVILTGMGNDGFEGARKIKKSGGRIIAQDDETSVIFGMPGKVVREGIADKVLPSDEIAGEIINSL